MDDEVPPTLDCQAEELLLANTAGHPILSTAERNLLAERIAIMDGITRVVARQQLDCFLSTDLIGICFGNSSVSTQDETASDELYQPSLVYKT